MQSLSRCLPWAQQPVADDPAPVARQPTARSGVVELADSGDLADKVEREPSPRPLPPSVVGPLPGASRPRPPSPPPYSLRPLPPGARSINRSRSVHGNERRIETAHYRYQARRPAAGRLWQVTAHPVSAAARYYLDARGEALTFNCPLASLPAYIDQCERELEGYWGDTLDTRRNWSPPS